METPAIRMEKITKRFGTVVANENISFQVFGGEIHALLGENGAGKSTLMNMLSGIYLPDGGGIRVNGGRVSFRSPKDSIAKGIGMVQQHFKLVEVFTARENIVAGTRGGIFSNKKETTAKILEICEKYGFNIEPEKKIYDMSVSEKQTVEIIKVLYRGAQILILDEPTAVLTPQEIKRLFDVLRNMKKAGRAVIIITHKLDEVMDVADRITVLRKGKTVATLDKNTTNPQELTEIMVGRRVTLSIDRPAPQKNDKFFKVDGLTVLDAEKVGVLKDVSFKVRGGEVLGVAGVAGSGQKELCETIAGLIKPQSGDILFDGESVVSCTPREILKKGISMSFIPEDRLGMGLVASMDIVDNMALKSYQNDKGPFVDRKSARAAALELVERLSIQTPDVNTPVKLLSGGNIQKVLVGRELTLPLHVLITAYPSRGLDINSSYQIYDMINEQKKKGVAIIYVGGDLDVLLELCDRIMVLCSGRVMGTVDAAAATKEELGLMMTGYKGGQGNGENS